MRLFAPCPRGLEALLRQEIEVIGGAQARQAPGGVAFEGDQDTVYRVNLYSRLASRVLMQIGEGRYRDEEDIYRAALRIEWEHHLHCRQTLRVDTTAVRSPLRSLNFANLRVKDAIVDRLRERQGERPTIDTQRPDVRVFSFLREDTLTLYLDTSGESLFKRGWRREREDKGLAPLKENLAAGVIALAGWTPQRPLFDPFCGSGTLLIEAAQMALGIAPGLSRPFGFERLIGHDAAHWAALRAQAIREAQQSGRDGSAGLRLHGSDIDPQAIGQARRNIERAGVGAVGITLEVADAGQLRAPFEEPGVIITNPPYGERLDAQEVRPAEHTPRLRPASSAAAGARTDPPPDRRIAPTGRTLRLPSAAARAAAAAREAPPATAPAPASTDAVEGNAHQRAMAAFGRALKANFAGWEVHVLSSDRELPRQLGIKESRKTALFNGAIECRLFRFEVFDRRTREAHDRLHAERHARLREGGVAPARGDPGESAA